MRYLFDTHALIWSFGQSARVPQRVKDAASAADAIVYVSAATAMEITTKFRIGKLPEVAPFVKRFEALLAEAGYASLPITLTHAHLAGSLDIPHKDPFDRLLIAQAITDNLIFVSNERLFDGFGVKRLWD